jgi:hypothetical protein
VVETLLVFVGGKLGPDSLDLGFNDAGLILEFN